MYLKEKRNSCYGCSMTGVRRAAAHNPGAVLVFHSPVSCGQVIREKDSSSLKIYIDGLEQDTPLITSNISGNDVIFGAQGRLEQCLRFAIEKYGPEYILLGNSCIAGIIGDDIEAVAAEVSEESGVPVFTVPCCGFMNGGYETGVYEAAKKLLDYYVQPQHVKKREVTLIGLVDKNKNYEYLFMKRVLASLGITINCVFPGYASVQEMRCIGASQAVICCSKYNMVNKPFREIALKTAQAANTDMIDLPDPVGYGPALEWIKNIAKLLHVDSNRTDAVVLEEQTVMENVFSRYRKELQGSRALLYIAKKPDIIFDLSWYLDVIRQAGIVVQQVAFSVSFGREEAEALYRLYKLDACGMQLLVRKADFSEYDFILTVRWEQNRLTNGVPVPYVNPLFGAAGIAQHLEKMHRILMQRRHA